MPNNVVKYPGDEHEWNKAKAIAAKEGHAKDYKYIMGIFKKMNPNRFKKTASINPFLIGMVEGMGLQKEAINIIGGTKQVMGRAAGKVTSVVENTLAKAKNRLKGFKPDVGRIAPTPTNLGPITKITTTPRTRVAGPNDTIQPIRQ